MDNKPTMLIVDDVNINRTVLAQFFHDDYTEMPPIPSLEDRLIGC